MSVLHLERCRNHPVREAAVRCPECERFFCRECTVEHEGRHLCSACLAMEAQPRGEHQMRWRWVGIPLLCGLGLMIAWCWFGLFGLVLTEIPDNFHEGGYWRFLEESAR